MLNVTRSFLDPKVISRLAAVPLTPRFAMQGTVSGKHASPHRGSSIEFAEYRKYVPEEKPIDPLVSNTTQSRRFVSASNSLT